MNVKEASEDESPQYELIGSVIHLGMSIHVGLYIAYAKKDGQWVYFNDSKVARSEEPQLGKSFIFFLKKK